MLHKGGWKKKRARGCPSFSRRPRWGNRRTANGATSIADLPEEALLLIDTAPIIYVLEGHPPFGSRFAPLFAAHAAERLRFAVTTVTSISHMVAREERSS
jgi:hypothetical protein